MHKPTLTLGEINSLSAVELPDRNLFARAIGIGGLAGVAVAADLNDVVDVNVERNEICVNVAAVAAGLQGCDQ